MDQHIINLYDEYTHKPLSRNEFMKRLVALTGSVAAANAILPLIEVNPVHAAMTSDEHLFTETIHYPGVKGEMQAYVARPLAVKKYPVVIVIHENRGLNKHIEDVTRRAAQAGFLAIAPNALAPLGGTPENEDEARQKFTQLKQEDSIQNFIRVVDYISTRKDATDKIGCVGFCWGGAMANTLAVSIPSLKAAVAFYGRPPETKDVPNIKAAVQLHYASLDERVNAGIAVYEAALKENKVRFELYMYEQVNHAFHNDTAPTRYNEAAAKLAWKRTIEFFNTHLN
ncbi:MAG: dienelactone hydrolase family protein [Bacteroidetes bacterium]|nr:dienelactone hydrolase family protein [Bacteroidota bacterium]